MGACVCFCPRQLFPALPPEAVVRPADPARERWDLCALSGPEAMRLADCPLLCHTLLVPEGLYSPVWQAGQVVSFGLSGRSSLTLSSLDRRGLVCVQRSFTDRFGRPVEEQELCPGAGWGIFSPRDRLLLSGVWLLCRGALPDTGRPPI